MAELLKIYDARLIDDLPLTMIGHYLKHALKVEEEKVCWDMWLRLYPDMAKKNIEFIEFDKFKNQVLGNSRSMTRAKFAEINDKLSTDEIINEMEIVVAQYEKRR